MKPTVSGISYFRTTRTCRASLPFPISDAAGPAIPHYLRSRKLVPSEDNPHFYSGKAAEGLGGPHSGLNMIWPLGIITRALTSLDEREVAGCLPALKATHAGTGFMHESFSKDDAGKFTRPWFAWANTLFGELILYVRQKYPRLLA